VTSRSISPPRLHAPTLGAARAERLQRWPLIALLALAAVLRFATLDHQSLWYDEAVTAVRVLHPSLSATLNAVSHGENTPPFYYLLEWVWTRALGTGMFALRSLSALAGVGAVAVAWAIGLQLGSRRAAIVLAAIIATNPLFVWYSQEARSYELFVLLAAIALLYFLRAREAPTARNLAIWALCSALALATFYFAIFLVLTQAVLLLLEPAPSHRGRFRLALDGRLAAVAAVGAAALALLPLLLRQHGHGLGWITNWPLHGRLEAVGYYYLVGESGRPLGHLVMLAALAPIVAALALVPRLQAREREGAVLCAGIGVAAIVLPTLLALAGADYLAPRYLVAVYLPLSAALALVLAARSSRAGAILTALICLANLAVYAAVLRRPQLQRGDWRGAAALLRPGAPAERAVVVAAIGATPLQYYLPSLRPLDAHATVPVSEVDLVGYAPLRHGATRPPAPGLHLFARRSIHGIVVLRFRSQRPLAVPAQRLLAHRPVDVDTEALASDATR